MFHEVIVDVPIPFFATRSSVEAIVVVASPIGSCTEIVPSIRLISSDELPSMR